MLFTVVGADVRQRRRREPSNITSSSISTQPPNAASAGQSAVALSPLGFEYAFVELLHVGHDRQLELCCALRQVVDTACVSLASML